MESLQSLYNVSESIQVQVDPITRWNIYYRLLDLSIPCSCKMGEPLRVCVQDTLAAIQLWSVIRQATASRKEHIEWLNTCWQEQS